MTIDDLIRFLQNCPANVPVFVEQKEGRLQPIKGIHLMAKTSLLAAPDDTTSSEKYLILAVE